MDASSSATLYAANDKGIFITTDGASNWRALSNGLAGTWVLALVAHPTKTGTVFASIQTPPALFRSTDFGQSWTQLTTAPPNQVAPISAIVFGSNGTIFAAASHNILISADEGSTWKSGAAINEVNNQGLAISATNAGTLYVINVFGRGLGLSTDGGQSFTTVLSSVGFSPSARIAVDPRNPSTVYVADYNVLYESTDSGQSWTSLSLPYAFVPETIFASPVNSQLFLGTAVGSNAFVMKLSVDGSQVFYATYLGGSGADQTTGIAVDGNGSAYVTGNTTSPDFPTTQGAFQTKPSGQDIFVTKLSPDGSKLVYSTVFGSLKAYSTGVAVDSGGDAVVVGSGSSNFPVTPGAFQTTAAVGTCNNSQWASSPGSAFVARMASSGSTLVYSTLLGKTCSSYTAAVALDLSGNAWIAGQTTSLNFPVTSDALQSTFGGDVDGFVASFSPSGSLRYSTYLGGSGPDFLNAIAFDGSGNIYVTGQTAGLSQPASPGAVQSQVKADCFVGQFPGQTDESGNAAVVKLDPKAHSILRLTYLGAPFCLSPTTIAVDSSGEPWIAGPLNPAGSAPQTANPLRIGPNQGFISKFSADFTQLLFSTYFDAVWGLALDSSGSAYVAANISATYATPPLAYIAKIDPTSEAISLDSIVSPDPSVNPSVDYGVAAGEVIHLVGKNMGPATPTRGIVNSGVLVTNVAGVQVTFDGVAVPLLAVSDQEIDLVAPFELAGKSTTTIQVHYNGAESNAVQVGVNTALLQVLGVYNDDFTPNSAANPAKAGSIMSLYVSGGGQTNPPSQDGQVNAAPYRPPAVAIQLSSYATNQTVISLPITFAGAAPGLAAGIFQINFTAPQSSPYVIIQNSAERFQVWVQ